MKRSQRLLTAIAASALTPLSALAEGEAVAKIDTGDTAWLLVSAALVFLMTPGLAFFYGGLVRTKNVVSTLYQNFIALGVVGLLWAVIGYSLAFSGNIGGVIGDLGFMLLNGVGQEPSSYSATTPHLAFMLFQCMFAVITPALITGAFAERIHFRGWVLFLACWSLLVYSPVAHWVWGGGWIQRLGGLDFAGGMVVHMTAGYSALTAAILLGKRRDFGKAEAKPYDAGMVLLGTALLWFGWFGFNAGSALTSGGLASHAFATTFLSAAAAMLSWSLVDRIMKGKASAIGAGIGVVAGLVAITPGAGFVSTSSAMLIGILAGAICNLIAIMVKNKLGIDDTLDVFACHGVGGTLGSLAVAFFASKAVNPAGQDGLLYGSSALVMPQILGSAGTVLISVAGTFVIIQAVKLFSPILVTSQEEMIGLDMTMHGESINSGINN